MLCVISPAKKLDESPCALPEGHALTEPDFAAEALELAQIARSLPVDGLQKLMGLSPALAQLNHERFATLIRPPAPGEVSPAAYCFAGDTYQGLRARSFSARAASHASGHLRVLSGLYGLLRPFDMIRPYRLEMGSRLANPRGRDLYAFWGDKLAQALNRLGQEQGCDCLVNCASAEYFTAVQRKALTLRVITPVFLEERDGKARVISFHAKRARGAMARHICENAVTDPKALRDFNEAGYTFRDDLSEDGRMVFARPDPGPAKPARQKPEPA